MNDAGGLATSPPVGFNLNQARTSQLVLSVMPPNLTRFLNCLKVNGIHLGGRGEHDCDATLCVRVDHGHLKLGTQSANLAHAVAVGRHLGPMPAGGDPRGRYGRAVAIRDALTGGYDEPRLHAALAGHSVDAQAPPTLF